MTTPHSYAPIFIESRDGASAEISWHGGHIISWKNAQGEEQLFLSKLAEFREGTAIRGGVPVIFPQFADFGPLPKHGFARTMGWEFIAQTKDTVVMRLTDNDSTRAIWSHAFVAEVMVIVREDYLDMTLRIKNTDTKPFTFSAALHTYFQVGNVETVFVQGLEGLTYLDEVTKLEHQDLAPQVMFEGEVDRLYYGTPDPVKLHDGDRTIEVTSTGFTKTAIWNPGPVLGRKLKDLEPNGYQRFVCIEAVIVREPVTLEAGAKWEGSQRLKCTRTNDK